MLFGSFSTRNISNRLLTSNNSTNVDNDNSANVDDNSASNNRDSLLDKSFSLSPPSLESREELTATDTTIGDSSSLYHRPLS